MSDTAPEFRSADIVVAPSRWDGLSLVLLEAMACGAAIVATNVSGSEVLEQVGVVVEPDDSAALAEAIDVLLDDVTTRQQLGLRARERSRLFDLETNLGLNLSLWSELAAQVRQ